MSKQATVLIVAGSDSGGGAGIQGDIKTVSACGAYASTAITALTAQNTLGVQAIEPIKPSFVAAQMDSVLSDIGADAIKTGMLYDEHIIETVGDKLREYRNIPLIVDPVMVAKGGQPLLKNEALEAMKRHIFPLAKLITPNIPEAEMLTGMLINNVEGMVKAGKRILSQSGAQAILIKGGHLPNSTLTDILITQNDISYYTAKKINSKHTHGTGCALASAIAAYTAKGHNLTTAIEKAHQYLQMAIRHAPKLGKAQGPLGHFWMLDKK